LDQLLPGEERRAFQCRRLGRRERWTEVHRTHTGRAGPWALRSSLNE